MGNHFLFMTKKLSKAIMKKSKRRNKYLKWPSRENYVSFKKPKNKCNSLTKKTKTTFKEAIKDEIMSNKIFWSTRVEKDGDLISNEKEIVELFN